MSRLAGAPAAKTATTPASAARQRVTSLAAYTRRRAGSWVSTVFHVPQAYSPSAASTPRISISAPRKTGRPPIELPTSRSGSRASRPRSARGPPVPPAYPAYGIR
nr:hypothetical protein GCM10020092_030720 [Actinoplanes digitatis]